jgi:hypothetical protein
MRIRDKELKEVVDVCDRDCPKKTCYWPRPDPLRSYGYFVWVCRTRYAHGCPTDDPIDKRAMVVNPIARFLLQEFPQASFMQTKENHCYIFIGDRKIFVHSANSGKWVFRDIRGDMRRAIRAERIMT